MSLSDALAVLVHLFNDIVGTLLPGCFFVGGLTVLGAIPLNVVTDPVAASPWGFLLASFVAGHGLLAIHELADSLLGRFPLPSFLQVSDTDKRAGEEAYRLFVERARAVGLLSEQDGTAVLPNNARSVAMSLSSEAAELGRRFRFIALFCFGTGWAACFLAVLGLVKGNLAISVGLILLSCVMWSRGRSFTHRAHRTPFTVAVAALHKLARPVDKSS